jgi:hypothetical protein
MADKNWGIKIYCECGAKYYSMNKKDKILCPVCSAEYLPEDLNLRSAAISAPKIEPKKKLDDIENIDDAPEEESDDIISLDDQKEIEETNEEFKPD